MGNVSSNVQRLNDIITSETTSTGISIGFAECKQEMNITLKNSPNCAILLEQTCKSVAIVDADALIDTLSKAKLTSKDEKHAEGLALSTNVSVDSKDRTNQVLNVLKTNCTASATTDVTQEATLVIEDTDCSNLPGNQVARLIQTGSAEADCIMRSIVKHVSDTEMHTEVKQTNIGLSMAGIIGAAICIMILVAMFFIGKKMLAKGAVKRGAGQVMNVPNQPLPTNAGGGGQGNAQRPPNRAAANGAGQSQSTVSTFIQKPPVPVVIATPVKPVPVVIATRVKG